MFDFETVHDRARWSSTKWLRYENRDVIPLWIADMDFSVAPEIQAAVARHVAHGNFGYMSVPASLSRQLVQFHEERYGWSIEPGWVVWLPGLVLGLNLAIRTCSAPGEAVATFSPVYPPFLSAPAEQGRLLLDVPLKEGHAAGMTFEIDFEALEAALACPVAETGRIRLLMLCHPHNPIGRPLAREEMERLASLCERHDLYVCSDEVHCDLILDGTTPHVPFGKVAHERGRGLQERVITLHGLGKTYNLAGLGLAWAVIPDAELRKRFCASMQRLVPDASCMSYTAAQAALTRAEPWRQELLSKLRTNRELVAAALDRMRLPHTRPTTSYLTWIDARRVAESVGNPAQWFERHGVGLSDGTDFGRAGFLRLNFAAPTRLLQQALVRMERAMGLLN